MAPFREAIQSLKSKYAPLQIVSWVWQDALRPYSRKIHWINILQILSVVTSFSGFAVLYLYVDIIETNEPFIFLQYSFEPRQSQALLILIAGLVGLLFLSTGLLDYSFHKRLIQINRLFEMGCVVRLYESVMQKKRMLQYQSQPILSAYNIKKSLIKDTKYYGRALFSIVKAIIPIAKLLLSLTFMFYLAFSFTLLVISLMLIGGVFLWKITKSVVKETKRKEKYIKSYVKELSNALSNPMSGAALLDKKSAVHYFSAFYTWLLNTEQSRLIINLLITGITFFLLLIIGHLTLFGGASWALLVGYLLALRYLLNSLQGINGILKQLSTFYDYIRNYYAILEALATLEETAILQSDKIDDNMDNDYFQFQPDDDAGDDLVDDF
jgi:ABC-type multidrug transport system fused ATPase/permease subunit